MIGKTYNGLLQKPSVNRVICKHEFHERDEYAKKLITEYAVSSGLDVIRCRYDASMSSQDSSAYLLVVKAKYKDIEFNNPTPPGFKLIMNNQIWNPLSEEDVYRAILSIKDIDIDNQIV